MTIFYLIYHWYYGYIVTSVPEFYSNTIIIGNYGEDVIKAYKDKDLYTSGVAHRTADYQLSPTSGQKNSF